MIETLGHQQAGLKKLNRQVLKDSKQKMSFGDLDEYLCVQRIGNDEIEKRTSFAELRQFRTKLSKKCAQKLRANCGCREHFVFQGIILWQAKQGTFYAQDRI